MFSYVTCDCWLLLVQFLEDGMVLFPSGFHFYVSTVQSFVLVTNVKMQAF
jgi:hypothetical protein